ncbi:MAG: sigma-70 family RNA polymerase sigma factor [Firmicutes bacterium]|nr:sigma-70 family RNA polymerase sigma factor [Bacillota bacterium]
MKTLRTLQQMVEEAPPTGKVKLPTPAALRESGAAIVEVKITEDKSFLLVYENGYVVYDNGSRSTVLRLHDVDGCYRYHPYSGIIQPGMCIYDEDIMAMPWFLGTLMFAEDRIVHSQNNSSGNQNVFPAGFVSETVFGLVDPDPDPLEQVIKHQDLLETIRIVNFALSQITEDQRRVVVEYFSSDEKKKEIAKRLDMSPQLLNYFVQSGLRGMRKALGVKEKKE